MGGTSYLNLVVFPQDFIPTTSSEEFWPATEQAEVHEGHVGVVLGEGLQRGGVFLQPVLHRVQLVLMLPQLRLRRQWHQRSCLVVLSK